MLGGTILSLLSLNFLGVVSAAVASAGAAEFEEFFSLESPPLEVSDSLLDREIDELSRETPEPSSPIAVNYFGILYGPSLQRSVGVTDQDRSLLFKNFLGPGLSLTEHIDLAGICVWTWAPGIKDQIQLQDPFLKLSHGSLVEVENLNIYSDVRVHFPAAVPGEIGFALGLQNVEAATYHFEGTPLTLGANFSIRRNFFYKLGVGDWLQIYFAPNVSYRVSSSVALTLLYEVFANHGAGSWDGNRVVQAPRSNHFGTNLEPGVSWDITPQLWMNPYLSFLPGNPVDLKSMSFGMMLGWTLL